ncbi:MULTISPECIES: hypothetical protein [Nostocales]|jgi:hypothetical protein|uniref:Secreted protein n=1 Tax=Nostoc punctiforme FACHB-252 TaxID=1357509 RepID=A0ABR8HFW1_NOSPU|nr:MULTISPECIES: hypothetical protein [Nostocales]MBW4685707.1 hypothetical protein [Komarekiella atlantica HA4396-MV6]BAY95145.1 hypothetical protein NIES3275_72020 [Microchaete diplosiphon NIES-3275]MBD2613993.1 hypothetical protein [Nostoc punctiforme FACHB-252]MBE9080701.1 hypothetical protein [Tolypothrix sp. LEGE 11397]UYD30346.1 hypothetical protein HGR01_36625 [Tolypothrix sp. PCC 7712]
MNKKFLLTLLSSSTIFTSLMSTLTVVHPAYAAATMTQRLVHTNDGRTCITHPHGNTSFVCIRDSERKLGAPPVPASAVISAQPSDSKVAVLNFTDEESDAAIRLFSCDCPYCLNSLRLLRGSGNLVY